jgi:hypothetical protein
MQPSTPGGTAAATNAPVGVAAEKAEAAKQLVPIAGDILYGADAVAKYLFGAPKHRRRVYNLVEAKRLPIFRIGANICARKSILLEWISVQEERNAKG